MWMISLFSKHHLDLLTRFENVCFLSIRTLSFIVKHEEDGLFLYLHVKICHKKERFVTNIYRKPTSSGYFNNYESFISTYQKENFYINCYIRSCRIYCDFKEFHSKTDKLKTTLKKLLSSKLGDLNNQWYVPVTRCGSRAAATSMMERFVIIVNGFQPLTIITKCSILDVVAVLDPPLVTVYFLVKIYHQYKVD